jgi:flagellar motor switch protein FliM
MKAKVEAPVKRLDLVGPERRLGNAVKAFDKVAKRFEKIARRSMPFLARHKAHLVNGEVRIGNTTGAPDKGAGPGYRVLLQTADGYAWAELHLNTDALAVIVDGSLGGASQGIDPKLVFKKDISSAQGAVIAKVAMSLAKDFADCVSVTSGLHLSESRGEALPAGTSVQLPKDALRVECEFVGLGLPAKLVLWIGAEMLEASVQEAPPEVNEGDPRMLSALQHVSVSVVAEIGTIELGLGRVLSLNKGETLRLSTAVDDPITLRVGGIRKFDVVPVISRGQLAVEVRGRCKDGGES